MKVYLPVWNFECSCVPLLVVFLCSLCPKFFKQKGWPFDLNERTLCPFPEIWHISETKGRINLSDPVYPVPRSLQGLLASLICQKNYQMITIKKFCLTFKTAFMKRSDWKSMLILFIKMTQLMFLINFIHQLFLKFQTIKEYKFIWKLLLLTTLIFIILSKTYWLTKSSIFFPKSSRVNTSNSKKISNCAWCWLELDELTICIKVSIKFLK